MSGGSPLSPQAVQALLRRERQAHVSRLLRGLVHNLSGALQMIRLPLDLLELKLRQGQTQDLDSKLMALQQGVSRLNAEVDMLAVQGSRNQEGHATPLDLPRLAAEQLAFWKADMFFKHEASVEQQLPPATFLAAAAYADAALAFNALVANALESLRASGARRLSVSYGEHEGRAVLSVADDGPGPSPEMAPVMFEPFVGDKGAGHDGLGLFLARQALLPWQGEVSWTADPVPCFQLSLPRRNA